MTRQITEKIIVGAATAVILGVLALIWNWATVGGLVRALGGVTQHDMGRLNPVPEGAVVAFDNADGCPTGWVLFEPAISRMVVGAIGPSGSTLVPNTDMQGKALSAFQYRSDGGEEGHLLLEAELPPHSHEILYQGHNIVTLDDTKFRNAGENRYLIKPEAFVGNEGNIRSTFTAMPKEDEAVVHNNMPPFVALYYCKKE